MDSSNRDCTIADAACQKHTAKWPAAGRPPAGKDTSYGRGIVQCSIGLPITLCRQGFSTPGDTAAKKRSMNNLNTLDLKRETINIARTTRPRIAVACSGLGHIFRGVETWAIDLARSLHNAGQNVTLFQGTGESSESWQHIVNCMKRTDVRAEKLSRRLVRLGGWKYGVGSGYQWEQTTFACKIWPHIRRDFDIVHTQDPWVALHLETAAATRIIATPCDSGARHGRTHPPTCKNSLSCSISRPAIWKRGRRPNPPANRRLLSAILSAQTVLRLGTANKPATRGICPRMPWWS